MAAQEILEHYLHPDAPAEDAAAAPFWMLLGGLPNIQGEHREHRPNCQEFEFPMCTLPVSAWILPDLIAELQAMQPPPGLGRKAVGRARMGQVRLR